jgi:hypothetical protein
MLIEAERGGRVGSAMRITGFHCPRERDSPHDERAAAVSRWFRTPNELSLHADLTDDGVAADAAAIIASLSSGATQRSPSRSKAESPVASFSMDQAMAARHSDQRQRAILSQQAPLA